LDLKYLTVEEIADMLRMHKSTIRNKIKKGKIKGCKIGKRWLVSEQDFIKYIDSMLRSVNNEKVI